MTVAEIGRDKDVFFRGGWEDDRGTAVWVQLRRGPLKNIT
jgi:hypothetical protein